MKHICYEVNKDTFFVFHNAKSLNLDMTQILVTKLLVNAEH